MPPPAGYTLDQLLSWCLEDRLIDDYQRSDRTIVITQGDMRHELAVDEAELFLKGIFKNSPFVRTRKIIGYPPGSVDQKRDNEA